MRIYFLEKKQKNKLAQLLRALPQTFGIYIFMSGEQKPIYVGKAINLRNRISSYFQNSLLVKTQRMISDAVYLGYIKVTSELEALLLEASLIHKHQPQYNIAAKDDKHPLYIRITNDEYPRVITARKIEEGNKNLAFFGPFPSSNNVNVTLRRLRKIIPYANHVPGSKPCLYHQLGLCNPCPSVIEHAKDKETKKLLKNRYRKNIKMLVNILKGQALKVKTDLQRQMLTLSKSQQYEQARDIRTQIERLEYITQPIRPTEDYLKNPSLAEDIHQDEVNQLAQLLKVVPTRIECFDVAHLSGTHPTASMVTFINAEADKSLYRHFRIRQDKKSDDISSMREVAGRRANNFQKWGKPDVILVDGGIGQINAFLSIMKKYNIPVVGLTKREETLIIPPDTKIRLTRGPAMDLVVRLRDEAHRFARTYHHKLISKSLITS